MRVYGTGIEKETEGLTLVSTRHSAPQFPLHPYSVHPFGGFDMCGTDSKAGGRDYLGLFLQAKSISEKLL